MAAAADKRGLKRICTSCGTRFYDMNKRPIVCPSCSVEFTSEIKVKVRRGRASTVVPEEGLGEDTSNKKPIVADAEEEEDSNLVSLDEVAEMEDADDVDEDEADADLDLDDDLDDLDDLDDDDLDEVEDAVEDDDAPKGKK